MTQKEKAYKVMRGLLRAAAFGSPIKGYNKAELRVIAQRFPPDADGTPFVKTLFEVLDEMLRTGGSKIRSAKQGTPAPYLRRDAGKDRKIMENWIKTNREALGLSQAKLAAAVGVGSTTVNAWEHEEKRPSAEAWTRLAAFFREHGLEVPPMPDDLPHGRRRFQRARMGTDPSKLREKRLAAGLTVAALAAALGVGRHTVTDWETGKNAPSKKAIAALAEFYQCAPAELGFPEIRNGLTVEERNELLRGYLEDISKAVYGMRRLLWASHTDQEEARQDAALAVLEAINRAEDPQDAESMRRYVFATIKGSVLKTAVQNTSRGFTQVPAGVFPVVISMTGFYENTTPGPWGLEDDET